MGFPAAVSILSGVFSAAGAIAQGNAMAAQYRYSAETAENNRRIAERQGAEALAEGAREEARFRRQARQFAATQEAALAAGGAQMGGSALNILADTAMGIEQDAEMIRYDTLKNKWGLDVQAVNFANERDSALASAKNAKAAGGVGAFSSILGTAAGVWANSPVNARMTGNVISVGTQGGRGAYPHSFTPYYRGDSLRRPEWWR